MWPNSSCLLLWHFVLLPETSHVDTASCLLVYQPTRGGDASGDATGAEVILIQNEDWCGVSLTRTSPTEFVVRWGREDKAAGEVAFKVRTSLKSPDDFNF